MFDPIALFWVLLWTCFAPYGIYLLLTNKTGSSLYVYGKHLNLKKKDGIFWKFYLLPKRYFMHFYVTATLTFISSFAIIFLYYMPGKLNAEVVKMSHALIHQIQRYVKIETVDTIDSITSLVFTVILMTLQTSRRLYECLFISVYSSHSKINVLHYILGHIFYLAAAISTLCPILLSNTSTKFTYIALLDNLVTKQRALAFVMFIYASHHQHKCNQIFANLRKDKTGRVITERHYVPTGGMFEYVSCPHYLFEVIIYFLILVAQEFRNIYWNSIFLVVASIQTISAMMEHKWYRNNYKDYPKERKAIVPGML